jgi:hypothetical protein
MAIEPNANGRSGSAGDALAECDDQLRHLKRKAQRNKRLTYLATLTVMLSSACIPILLLASTKTDAFLLGKLLPSLAAGVAALASGSVQLARPHDRWRMFRRAQRLLEIERMAYLHHVEPYSSNDSERLLIERVIDSRKSVLDEWLSLMPDTSTALASLQEKHRSSA